ncbi:MAG: ABC transporter ATP-binding protein [Chloroflexi bacterium]|nr:MAG: ABC transporter ATP-binding protein [Chloroflexota bacterium]
MDDLVLRVEGLTKFYGPVRALHDLTLSVRRGEVYGFLGPNGAGKTTTVSLVLGLIRPTAGRIELLGHDTRRGRRKVLHRVGAIVERPAFYPHLSGADNLRVAAWELGGVPEARIAQLLERVGLADRADDKVKGYSTGMVQRLGLAAALLNEPELLFLDEPTSGLDPAGQAEIRALIREMAEEGVTVFLCSHLLHEVEQVCHRVGILNKGELIAEGAVEELLRRKEVIQVRVADLERAAALLRRLDWVREVRREDDRLLVEAPIARSAEVNAALARQGLYASEIRPLETTLETFFLQVTQEEAGDGP